MILFLCNESEIVRERKGFADAFRDLGVEVQCTGQITSIKEFSKQLNSKVIGIIRPGAPSRILPWCTDKNMASSEYKQLPQYGIAWDGKLESYS